MKEKIRDFFNENKSVIKRKTRKSIFIIIGLISILIILQLGLKIIPLFKSEMEADFNKNLNEVLLALSLSYVAGLIIYLFINYFPERAKQKSYLKMIQQRIDIIVNDSFVFIAYLIKLNNNSNEYLSLRKSDFSRIQYLKKEKMGFAYYYDNNNHHRHSTGEYKEYEYYENIRDYTIKTIDDFYKIPSSLYMPGDLIEILSEIRD